MANKYVNKLIVGTEVKLDLSGDTIVASDLKRASPRTTSPARRSPARTSLTSTRRTRTLRLRRF